MTRYPHWAWAAVAASAVGLGYVAAAPGRAADDKGVKAAADAPDAAAGTFEVYRDKAGEYRWRLRAANRQVIATAGDGYKERRDCVAGIESVKRHAAAAAVVDAPAAP